MIIPIIFLIALSLSISSVKSWATLNEGGDWDTIGIGGFSWDGIDPGNATYSDNMNFSGLYVNITNTVPNVYSGIYGVYSYAETTATIRIIPNNSSFSPVIAKIVWRGDLYLFGVVKTYKTFVGIDNQDPAVIEPPFSTYLPVPGMWDISDCQIWILPYADVVKAYFLFYIPGQPTPLAVVFDVNSTLNLQDCQVIVEYDHTGSGHFEADLDWITDSGSIPSIPGYDVRGHAFDWLDTLNGFLGLDFGTLAIYLLTFLSLIALVVQIAIPLLGIIFVFWILDIIYTGIITGNVNLIGNMFITIYNFFVALVSAIMGFIGVIWDFITFWVP